MLARWGGTLAAALAPGRKDVHANLRTAFPGELSDREIARITRDFYTHAFLLAFEIVWLDRWSTEELRSRFELEGRNHLDEARGAGKGAILITAHMANWEACGAVAAGAGYPLKVVSRPQGESEVEDYLREMRTRHGLSLIKDNSPLDCLMALRRNQVLVLMIDGRARKGSEVMVPFLGRPFPAVAGPAILALRTGAPVFFFSSERLPDGRFRGRFVPLPTLRTGDQKRDTWLNTALYMHTLQNAIRECPSQHFFWKARPRPYPADPLYEEMVATNALEVALREASPEQS